MENLTDNIETNSEALKINSDHIETNVDEDWFAISFISYERPDRRAEFFAFANYLVSSMRTQFGARCHWGKYNPLDRRANEQLYPNLPAFRQVVKRFDPHSRFSNQWLRDVLLDNGP
jgi:FAD/FMN-containing dehydrogenase